jgi:hypothetical protein
VVRQNDIAGEELKNQRHPDRRSLVRAYEDKACNICYMVFGKRLKGQTEFSVGTLRREFSVGTTMRSARERLGANKLSRAGLISVTESF